MLNDFELITHKFPERQDISIIPISDVHLGAREHLERKWVDFCNTVNATDNVFITLGGDLINNGTRTSVSNIFDETMRPREQKRMMVEYLTPIKEKILCCVSGNHERRSGKDIDDDPTYDIMCKLDLEHLYRENMAFLRLQFGKIDGHGGSNPTYGIGVTHGSGGGILTGTSVNRNERFGYVFEGLDALIVGHTHKPAITQPAKVKVDMHNNKVSIKPFKVITSTAWLDYGGYALQKQLLPAAWTAQKLILAGKHKEIIAVM